MVVVHREYGFRFVILMGDHEPPHVHIYGDGEMKVTIIGADGRPEIVSKTGFKANDRRRVMDVMLERQAEFSARWREINGTD